MQAGTSAEPEHEGNHHAGERLELPHEARRVVLDVHAGVPASGRRRLFLGRIGAPAGVVAGAHQRVVVWQSQPHVGHDVEQEGAEVHHQRLPEPLRGQPLRPRPRRVRVGLVAGEYLHDQLQQREGVARLFDGHDHLELQVAGHVVHELVVDDVLGPPHCHAPVILDRGLVERAQDLHGAPAHPVDGCGDVHGGDGDHIHNGVDSRAPRDGQVVLSPAFQDYPLPDVGYHDRVRHGCLDRDAQGLLPTVAETKVFSEAIFGDHFQHHLQDDPHQTQGAGAVPQIGVFQGVRLRGATRT
mmetsp:Transcript_21704/g.60943  ORF Transcript_21704/g.60943 Transcript_21704/m.60943 type:complete len:298 (+) Transcript_21704:351-1244(+)